MHVVRRFVGDDHSSVMRMQHSVYERVIVDWVGHLIETYEHAESLTGSNTVAGSLAQNAQRFDHRAIQEVHDLIAAAFRHRLTPPTPLFEAAGHREDFTADWLEFAATEFGNLIRAEPRFAHALATAIGLANTSTGMAGEREAADFLRHEWYPSVPWRVLASGTSHEETATTPPPPPAAA